VLISSSLKSVKENSKGVALILVVFVVALATIVVVNLTYSNYLAARANAAMEQSLFAEYLLKSGINIAKAYVSAPKSLQADGPKDDWALFFGNGNEVPAEFLGLQDSNNLRLSLEVIAENRKLPIRDLIDVSSLTVNTKKRDILVRLFENLGFNNDLSEVVLTGPFRGKHFTSEELVANLIDFMDPDDISYSDPNFVSGIESDFPKGTFPNKSPNWVSELNQVPGLTSARLRVLETLITFWGTDTNINFAPAFILGSFSSTIRPDSPEVQQIIEYRNSDQGPFTNLQTLSNIVGSSYTDFSSGSGLGTVSEYFQIIGKVDLGVKSYFARAILFRNSANNTIDIKSVEFF
jgi:type II secretory pathway component PulK